MNLFLHICCAPCAIYPVSVLRARGVETEGFFFNPNIHPLTEYMRRLSALRAFSETVDLSLIVSEGYLLKEFLREVAFREDERCRFCYRLRLSRTADEARKRGADAFSTTLLYSIYQRHDEIRAVGEEVAAEYGVPFFYEDFRPGWKEGVRRSKEQGIYRQPYCGCIYSEVERYARQFVTSEQGQDPLKTGRDKSLARNH